MSQQKPKPSLPEPPQVAGRAFDVMVELFDRQIVDAEGQPVATVADIELENADFDAEVGEDARPPRIRAMLDGPVLATRIFGGRPPESRLHRIPWNSVTDLGAVVSIDTYSEDMDITWTERWMRDHVIGRIPGGHHDPD